MPTRKRNPAIRTLRATVAERVALAKRQILADVKAGHLPRSIRAFRDLHDHVDPNEYGGWFRPDAKWKFIGPNDMPTVERVYDGIDKWLKAGGIAKAKRNPSADRTPANPAKPRTSAKRNPRRNPQDSFDPTHYGSERAARAARDARAKVLRAAGHKVTKWALPNQEVRAGGLTMKGGTAYRHTGDGTVTIYGLDYDAKRNPSDGMAELRRQGEANTRAADALYMATHGRLPPVYTDAQRRADERATRTEGMEWRAPSVRAPGRKRNPAPSAVDFDLPRTFFPLPRFPGWESWIHPTGHAMIARRGGWTVATAGSNTWRVTGPDGKSRTVARFETGIKRANAVIDQPKRNPATAANRVTIYFTGPMGSIASKEGSLAGVDAHGVEFVPKGGRREHRIMTYYSPFIMVVRGWGKAKPGSGFGPASVSASGATTRRGLYRSNDPRWVSDFMRDIGGRFHPIALFENGQLVSGGE